MIHFKDIRFGQASAEEERSYFPDLLLDGFLDPWDAIDKAINTPLFLVLGYKGSGKSAIGQHLLLSSECNHGLFVNEFNLSDFPYGNFANIVTGDSEPESRFPSAWSWILLLYMINSFSKDNGALSNLRNEFLTPIRALRSIGLLPTDDLKKTILASSKPKFKAKLPPIFEIEVDSGSKKISDLQFLHIIEELKKLSLQFESDSQHIMVIDGLDEILLQKEIQYQSIAALVFEVNRLNALFFRNKVKAKFLVLCRTELFERLPAPNKNKLRQDLSIELDWYHNPQKPYLSKLAYLVNNRSQLADKSVKDVFLQLMPKDKEDKSILPFLLNHTRHTPRDLIMLLKHIQNCCQRKKIGFNNITAGIRQYSSKYFLPEILDELVGYTNIKQAENIIKAISLVKKNRFGVEDISEYFKALMGRDKSFSSILDTLFQCSAIGNVKYSPLGKQYFSFKYRNRHASFNPKEEIYLHKGLWKGMNII